MTDSLRPARASACGAGRSERVAQALVGVLLAAYALDHVDRPLLAGAVGALAALLLVGAARGWCPGSLPMLLASRRAVRPNRHGIPEARQDLLG